MSWRQTSGLASETEPDGLFLTRFRARRDELSVAPWWTWRQLAMRLVPVALILVAAATASVLFSLEEPAQENDIQILELQALGDFEAIPEEDRSALDPVLEITLEPFPVEEP